MKRVLLVSVILAAMLLSACAAPVRTPTPTTPKPTPPTSSSSASARPSGTYTATLFGNEQSLTFRGDVLERYDRLEGKAIFRYTISEDGSTITTTNVVSGVIETLAFKYIKEFECVVLYAGNTPIQYYKK